MDRRRFLAGAAAAGAAAGAARLLGVPAGAAVEMEPQSRVKVKEPSKEQQKTKKKDTDSRPLLYGAGMIWAFWLNRPRSYDLKQMDKLVDLGATLTSATFDWVDLEKEPGKFDWSYPDHTVEAAQKRGLRQFGYIGNTAAWALPPGVTKDKSYRFPPDDRFRKEFENYCRSVAKRYRGQVEMFQFWNEPNGCSWVNDGCANGHEQELYTKWLKIAYNALKEGNPDCIVAGGALDYNEGVTEGYRYIEGMYRYGAKGHFDAISIHPYHPEGLHWKAVEDTYRVMKEHGDGDKQVWLTEYGWVDSRGEDAARKLREVLTRLASPEYRYVTLANYLCVTDLPIENTEQYGLCDRELNERPIAKAFRELAKGARERL